MRPSLQKEGKNMLVAIGSTNPVKINAVIKAFKKAFPKVEFEFESTEVNSEVSAQPKTDEETRKGAKNRALKALTKFNADFGVGLEGGVMETEVGMFETAWCCVVDKNKTIGFGGGLHFCLPEKISERIKNGEELGEIMDDLTNIKDIKKKGGAVEIFTNKMITRESAYINLVILALTKFVAKEWY